MVLKCFRPDKLTAGLRLFVIQSLGEKFVEPPTFNLAGCFLGKSCPQLEGPVYGAMCLQSNVFTEQCVLPCSAPSASLPLPADSSCTTPLLFVLSPGTAPTAPPSPCRLVVYHTAPVRALPWHRPHRRSAQVCRGPRAVRGEAAGHLHGPRSRAQSSSSHRGLTPDGVMGPAAGTLIASNCTPCRCTLLQTEGCSWNRVFIVRGATVELCFIVTELPPGSELDAQPRQDL